MYMDKVKNAQKIGNFFLTEHQKNKINLKYLNNIDNKILIDNSPRIYIFSVDDVIKKIGGSASTGGIKATMSFYVNAMTGSPGASRFVIHLLIAEALKKGSKVELYMITSPRTLAQVYGLFSTKEVLIASFKEMENLCKFDYYSIEKKYPDWNFQENNEEYPLKLSEKFYLYHQNRTSNK